MPKNPSSITFVPAELSEGKEWFVFYWVLNPAVGRLHRKKVKINRIKSISERRKFAKALIRDINDKLYSGWNPFLEESAKRGFVLLQESLTLFLDSKARELRPDSMRSYTSFIKKFNEWLEATNRKAMFTVNFSKADAVEWMNYLYITKKMKNRTWNNYRLFFLILWNWMVEQQFSADNVFNGIRKKQQGKKDRVIIPASVRDQVREHLEANDYNYLVVCMLVFHALIRPKEICMLKPADFLLKKQLIRVGSRIAKNKSDRLPTIPDSLMPFLVQWNFNGAANNEYIFSGDHKPGKTPMNPRYLSKKWDQLRRDLKLDASMKLYSLRDSGIVKMLEDGISPKEVMHQADHSSLEVTSIYLEYVNPEGSAQIRERFGSF